MTREYRIEICDQNGWGDWEAYDATYDSLDMAYAEALNLKKQYDYSCRVVEIVTNIIIPTV